MRVDFTPAVRHLVHLNVDFLAFW